MDTYDRFLMSQIIEAGIVGVMIFAAYSLVGLPYAGLVGVLAGVFSVSYTHLTLPTKLEV